MQTNSNGTSAEASDLGNLFVREALHISQDEDYAILRGQSLDGLPQPACLLAPDRTCFRIDATLGPQAVDLLPVGHQFFEGKILLGSELAPPPGHEAPVLRHSIEPDN